ncbi:MAG: hypothetical protein JST79_13375 [Acidobacteria bacterium]|nr:hypothetical protein [Acidobacteriota bacterium]
MRIRRRLPILLGVVLVAAAVALVVVLRKHAPPEAARLLPGADGFVYVNLQWIRRANVTGQLPAVSHDPDYEQFIKETGFQFEHDLDEVAFAIHSSSSSPVPWSGNEPRYSEIFVGKIDVDRLRGYLQKLATQVEKYKEINIYSIPLEGRTVRVAILSVDMVAASNHPDPEMIRGMVERSRKLASPFAGPALLRQYYKQVPFASLAWAVTRVDPSDARPNPGPLGLSFLFRKPAVVVASVRYLGSIHVRAEAFTETDLEAEQLQSQLTTFLALFQSAEINLPSPGSDADVKHFFDSLKVQQSSNHVTLSATVPPGFLHKVFTEPPPEAPAPAPPVATPPAKPGPKSKRP